MNRPFKVVILQYRLLHYRVTLFELLKQYLQDANIELVLVHGQASPAEKIRKDEGELEWAAKVRNTFISIRGRDILWQPLPDVACKADLYIVMQENRILSNYPLLLKRYFGGAPVAYWGHGRNFQSTAPTGLRERWKRWTIGAVDWWFAYTNITVSYLRDCGFPLNRITNLKNAIDVKSFRIELRSVTEDELDRSRRDLSIPEQARVGLYCGSLYPGKRLELLINGADLIKSAIPSFHLVIVGDGPSLGEVQSMARSRPWIHPVGVKKGHEKAVFFRLAHVQLNPGLVGLHILDSFAAGLPMVTTSSAMHSPEIAYLADGENGVIVQGDAVSDYSDSVIDLLGNEVERLAMAKRCLEAADQYTVENMARRFVEGVLQCLATRSVRDLR